MYKLDVTLTHWINAWAGSYGLLDSIMLAVSAVGVPVLVLAVMAQWWLPRRERARRHILLAAGLSFVLGLAINQIILLFLHRVRPYDGGVTTLLIARSGDFSFPSDHATAIFAIAAAFILGRLPRSGLFFLAAAVLVAVSRVYVGTHFVGDVAGGAVTGALAAVLVKLAYREGTRVDQFVTSIL